MIYICLKCGHRWDRDLRSLNIECPKCRTTRVAPEGFEEMVNIGIQMGINADTPFRDLITAFSIVWSNYGILDLGCLEFRRVMRLLIEEVENRKKEKPV